MPRLTVLIMVLMLAFAMVACGGGSSSDDDDDRDVGDDDDTPPIVGDDDDDDDTGDDDDNDTGDDDDNDTGDDDTSPDDDTTPADDDTTPADDDTTPADDDTTPVDDDTTPVDDDTTPVDDDTTPVDDDTTPEEPTVEIVVPEEGQTYYSNEQTVSINISNAAAVTVRLDGDDVTDQLTITDTTVTGTVDGVTAGGHTLSALVENDPYSATDSVTFNVDIDDPYLDLTLTKYAAQLGTEITRDVHVYDEMGNDITSQVTIAYDIDPETGFTQNGDVFTFEEPGTWTFSASCEYSGKKIELSDEEDHEGFDHIPTSIELHMSGTEVQAGHSLVANTSVYNSFSQLLQDFAVDFDVDPPNVDISGSQITFYTATQHTVTAFPVGYPAVTDEALIDVTPGAPLDLELSVSDNHIDAGEVIDYEVEMADAYGNQYTSGWTIEVDPDDGVIVDEEEQTITFAKAGNFTVGAHYYTLHDYATVIVTDNVPPTLTWTSPDRGLFTADSMITLEGYVEDIGSDVDTLTINGFNVTFSDTGQFYWLTALDVGYNLFEAIVEDEAGNSNKYAISVLRGSHLDNESWVDDAIGARVNESGLNKIEEIANAYLAEFDITTLLPDPLIDETIDLGITTCNVYATITDVDYALAVNLEAYYGFIEAEVEITDFLISVDFTLECSDGGEALYQGTVAFSYLQASVPVYIDVVDNELSVTLGDVSIGEPQGFDLTITGFDPTLVNLLEGILAGTLIPMAEDMINDIIQTEVPPLIEEALADLELYFEFELLDKTLAVEAAFESIDIDEGGIALWMNARATATAYDPNVPDLPGSLWTPGSPPVMGNNSPGGQSYQLGAVISDDILNQALYIVFRAGLLNMTLDETSGISLELYAGDLELFFPGISDIYGEEAPVLIKLHGLLPPILDLSPADAAQVELQLGEMFVDVVVTNEFEEETLVLQMLVYVEAPVTVDANATGDAFTFTFGEMTVNLDVVESMSLLPDAFFEGFVPVLIDFILPLISQFLEDFPIPSFEGYSMNVKELTVTGFLEDYLGVYGDLIEAPPALDFLFGIGW